jgi:peptide/nickel transport system permease protein
MSPSYLARRLLALPVILFFVSLIVFAITQILPGNAAVMVLGQNATASELAALEAQLGLDQPWYAQYLHWLWGVLRGDAGVSMVSNRPVMEMIAPALGRSLLLAGATLAAVVVIAVLLGVWAAVKRGRPTDIIISILTYPGVCVPEFIVGTLLIVLLARPELGWFPAGGYAPPSEGWWPFLSHLILPVGALTFILASHISRQIRSEMIDVLKSDFVRSATIRGLDRVTVLFRHALPNALLPTLTIVALDIGYLIGGIVVVEEVFAYPGLGRLLIFSMQSRDLPLIQAGVLVMAAVYVTANLLADLAHAWFDPRVQLDA